MLMLQQSLKTTFGFDEFRTGQEQTITQLLNGDSSLAIFPTGAGKSLCYQLAAINLPHLTLVVSPLLALMKDQLAFLHTKGIAAASIDSTLSFEESQQITRDVRSGKIKILMVSVERFKNERFRQFIEAIAISMLVVDEAHCISEWGHNFRPDYLKLPRYRQELNIPLVLLLTATATKQVKQDMANKFAITDEHIVQTGFYRSNLDLSVLPVAEKEKNQTLVDLIGQHQGCGIIYVTLQHSAEKVADFLQQQGIAAKAYHAGFKDDVRKQIQQDFMQGKTPIIVATIAFGMGIDKANIRFVIHYDLPKSIENYSQEIGRAGRDKANAGCFTLANLDGIHTVENFVYADTPERSSIDYVLQNIRNEMQDGQWELQVLSLSNASNIKQLPLKTLLVQLELLGVIDAKFSYFADFKFKFVTPKAQIISAFNAERNEFLAQVFNCAKMKKIWGEPDFDLMYARHQAPRKRIVAALEYLAEQQHIVLETKKATEVFSVNMVALENNALVDTLFDYFSDKEQAEIERITKLVAFFQSEHCLTQQLSQYFDDQRAPKNCGHCSVCRGQVAILPYSSNHQTVSVDNIALGIKQLQQHFSTLKSPAGQSANILSIDTICRFLSGMSVPLFTRAKVRQLSYFGVCQYMRYSEIKAQVIPLV
ncbi:RecQ family ATP-dependent DNA helicase [Colwellia sp. MB3u-70]|uniref:RecQ family ATP-dependent DNA helicase n=1 Tax=unclassified Colwellia TaxID=196834 RepID=UPI0015F381E8|nr:MULTISPECIES: RecQ family ATP-dependent DNA helicase [unclassified Colwellia]MBA6291739.1 RecQ family ATP-dependent DNA helicase [Colwellia sp. MB3u-8]MBA6308383.1 RecQ family ATP-dependent DNA helicase [Colwellia sp. MB3u-70]